MVCFRASREAWAANAKTAISRHAVLPDAVGRAMASGQGEFVPSSTLFAKSCCQAKGGLSHNALKNPAKSLAFNSLMVVAPVIHGAAKSISPEPTGTDKQGSAHRFVKDDHRMVVAPFAAIVLAR